MPLDIRLKPVEELLFRGDVVAVGKFRCASTHPLFRDSGPCSHHTFVFPRSTTAIRLADGTAFVGSPGGMAMYNQHQEYTRTAISEVDASDWFTIADDVLLELMSAHDTRATESRPFRIAEAACDRVSFLEQRSVFDALAGGETLDPLQVEESVLRAISRVIAKAYGARRRRIDTDTIDIDAVEQARHLIAAEPARNLTLRQLGALCALSPYELCRQFRARTGETLTRYRHSLRLRLALDRLRDRELDLTTLALDLGYSSHSHFTLVFRKHFGLTPSQFRDSGASLA
ncbi:MAG TPA: AraC family transcriptional regulator [Thermoanaerobaculia bacterium]|nr:AraC family transcriptional regulator [Thermoanaerobaculia bacterium]